MYDETCHFIFVCLLDWLFILFFLHNRFCAHMHKLQISHSLCLYLSLFSAHNSVHRTRAKKSELFSFFSKLYLLLLSLLFTLCSLSYKITRRIFSSNLFKTIFCIQLQTICVRVETRILLLRSKV